jgi:hypothetical protein
MNSRPVQPVQADRLRSAAIHLDVDGATDIFQSHDWPWAYRDDPIFTTGLRGFLDLFHECSVQATLFVVARDVDEPSKRSLLEEAVRHGHEIASHTVTHRHLPKLSSSEKREEIFRSKDSLEQALGVRVSGFRAPGYLLDRESMELLVEAGYVYDSSAFATRAHAHRLRLPVHTLDKPHFPLAGRDFVEWPMPDHRPSPVPFNPSYALLFGLWYYRWGLGRYRAAGTPLALLFHLIDAADPLASDRLRGVASRVYTLSHRSASAKRARCRRMIELVAKSYRITTTRELVESWRSGGRTGLAETPFPETLRA